MQKSIQLNLDEYAHYLLSFAPCDVYIKVRSLPVSRDEKEQILNLWRDLLSRFDGRIEFEEFPTIFRRPKRKATKREILLSIVVIFVYVAAAIGIGVFLNFIFSDLLHISFWIISILLPATIILLGIAFYNYLKYYSSTSKDERIEILQYRQKLYHDDDVKK